MDIIIKNGTTIFKKIMPLLLMVLLVACTNTSVKGQNVEKHYIINTNSKKIHIGSCNSVAIMSNRNKKEVNSTINDLYKKGYVICKNCRAGIKLSIIDQMLEMFNKVQNIENHDKEEYLKAIDLIGKWYAEHIPTYQTELEEEKMLDANLEINRVKKYTIKNSLHGQPETEKNYYVISTSNDALNIGSNISILKANENAVKYYVDTYDFIKAKKKKDTYYYQCEYIKNSIGTYDNAGDDCVRFLFSILNTIDSSFVYKIEKVFGRNWSKINSTMIATDNNKVINVKIIGFEIYDSYNTKGAQLITNNFKLEKGDILARKGHIHIYLGDEKNKDNSFGWGKVNRFYPQEKHFYVDEISGANCLSCIEKDNNGKDIIKNYTRIYRYVGGANEEK